MHPAAFHNFSLCERPENLEPISIFERELSHICTIERNDFRAFGGTGPDYGATSQPVEQRYSARQTGYASDPFPEDTPRRNPFAASPLK
jgi:hypothetical protein